MPGTIIYGYLRESNADSSDEEAQRRTIRELATRHGLEHEGIEWVSDWNRSGRYARPGAQRMRESVEGDRVHAVLAVSVDRLGRDAAMTQAFIATCAQHGTRVLTERDGERGQPDQNTIVEWLPALIAQEESRLGRERASRGRRTRAANREAHRKMCVYGPDGAHLDGGGRARVCPDTLHWDGRPPYGARQGEELHAVLDAYANARGYAQAATALNDAGILSRGGRHWSSTTVMRIIRWSDGFRARPAGRVETEYAPRWLTQHQREAGSVLPAGLRYIHEPHPHHRASQVHALSGLVTCGHDGTTLTVTRRQERRGLGVGLFCRVGLVSREHPHPYYIAQPRLMDWLNAAADQVLLSPLEVAHERNADAVRALDDRLATNRERFLADAMTASEYDQQRSAIERERAGIEAGELSATDSWLIGIDWRGDDRQVNTWLRQRIVRIEMGDSFRPVAVVWRLAVEGHNGRQSEPVAGGWRLPFTMLRGGSRFLVPTNPAFERAIEQRIESAHAEAVAKEAA